MVFGPILNKLNVLLQGVNILSVIDCHEEHNFICIQIHFALQWVKVRVRVTLTYPNTLGPIPVHISSEKFIYVK